MKRGSSTNDDYIVPVYVIIDDILKAMHYPDDCRVDLSAAHYRHNHHQRALGLLFQLGYIPRFSIWRFNRRRHARYETLWQVVMLTGEVLSTGTVFILDAAPLPVCKRVRAKRCGKVQGKDFEGFCASKREYYFGWQLHLLCDVQGIPVAFEMLSAKWDEVVQKALQAAALSGGQQQRLCIARSIAVEPEVLLMDEPCSALDPISTLKIEELMQELVKQYTIVLVTHNLQQAIRVSHRTAFLLADEHRVGQMIEYDTTKNIFFNPTDARTADYISGRFG